MTSDARPIQQASRRNHYVPVWYQAGFQINGAENWLMDISMTRAKPDGTQIVNRARKRPAKSSFWESELYVTRFGEVINDEVETVLFQEIDNYGSDAVRAFVSGDEHAMSMHLEPLISYLGAQKLRTPKGLDWIRSRYPALSQVELLIELQHLRHMFGALWAESVREIISAEQADIKFLISDHPVTMFNSALPSDAPQLAYPSDAPLFWNGTQTLFALDANNLLVLTHVPYAKSPNEVNATGKRINARYFGDALMRTDKLIRSRRINSDQVIAINGLLKSRARRYIAAAELDWLHPERYDHLTQNDLVQLLLPPEDELWHFGGETYIGYSDGTYGYRDQYGRTSTDHEIVEKPLPEEAPHSQDLCPCGSGKTYASCCEQMPQWQRAPWNVLSLRERNLKFLSALYNVLGLSNSVPWKHVQRELTDEQVSLVHRLSQSLWPADTDISALLPRRNQNEVRAVFMGLSDPRVIGENIIAISPMFDQILVMDPFVFARNLRPEFSPVDNPGEHKQQFLKNVMFWAALAPLIEAGKVLVFPDPGDINTEIRRAVFEMAKQRTTGWKMTQEEYKEMEWLGREDATRSLMRMSDEFWSRKIKQSNPDLSNEQIQDAVTFMREKQEEDPLSLLQDVTRDQPSQLIAMRGVNLEIALFIGQVTDSIIFTDTSASWRQLHTHTRAHSIEHAQTAIPSLSFIACTHPDKAVEICQSNESSLLRSAIARMKLAANQNPVSDEFIQSLNLVRNCLADLSSLVEFLPAEIPRTQLSLTLSTPEAGFESPTAQRLVVGFGSEDAPIKLGVAFFRRTGSDS